MKDMPVASCGAENFALDFDRSFSNIGFVSINNHDSLLSLERTIDNIKNELYDYLREFMALPLDVKMGYHMPEVNGQRGYTPDGIEQSGGRYFTEMREHLMIGPRLSDDHPLTKYRKLPLYLPNPQIKEVPGLVPLAEELYEKLEQLDLIMYKDIAAKLGLPPNYFSFKLAYGDSSLRLHHYSKLPEGVKIIGETIIKGVKALVVEYPNGNVVFNLIRAGRHTDINFSTSLLGADSPGLYIEDRRGNAVAYTAQKEHIVVNSGDYALIETAGRWPSSYHWVNLTRETAMTDRESIVRFGHFRTRPIVSPHPKFRTAEGQYLEIFEGVLLATRLCEIGYMKPEARDNLIKGINEELDDDNKLVDDILSWKARNGVNKLTRYAA